jgi:hypothetical protein
VADPAASAPDAPKLRREHPLLRWVTTAWCLLAGALLAVAPLASPSWESGFGWMPPDAQDALGTAAARWGIAGFGIALLALGAWDVARFVVEEIA